MTNPRQAPEQPAAMLDRVVGGWRIARHVATGAMGWIFAVAPVDGSAPSAILKLLRPGLNSAELRARFERERKILQHLHGEVGVPRGLGAGETNAGLPYFVMEFVPGAAADVFCARCGLRLSERIALVVEFGRVLARIHDRGVVHGDLKPENALASPGSAWLIDFGTARVIAPAAEAAEFALASDKGSQICTPQFASPEQLAGEPPTIPSDVYGLGALLYAVVCVRPPQERSGRSLSQFAAYVAQNAPRPVSEVAAGTWSGADSGRLLRAVDDVLARALAGRAAERFATAAEMLAELERIAQ